MTKMRILLLFPLLAGCSSLTLQNADFGWPVESAVSVGSTGMFEDPQRGLGVNVSPLSMAEFQDSTALRGAKLRILRSNAGYYFVTGAHFKHVYVFRPAENALTLYTTIDVSTAGLKEPALNQRPPYVELLDAALPTPLRLTHEGVVEGGNQ
jgi:hypothetical protein